MAQVRGSAMAATAGLLCLLLLQFEVTQAAVYVVGGRGGWTFNVSSWPNGKWFKHKDILVFNYNASLHNVVVVKKKGYNTCKPERGAKEYRTGKDRIKVRKGHNYFICTVPDHCEYGGMKIAVPAI